MAPANLQGLNIIHPAPHSDAQDLLSGPPFPDLSAQLDLWTNLTFDSDEGPLSGHHDNNKHGAKNVGDEEEEEEQARSPVTGEKAIHDGHINVVTGTNLGTDQTHGHPPQSFDLNAFLAGFGIDPFAPAPVQHAPALGMAPSLAQLIALHQPPSAGFPTQDGFQQPQSYTRSNERPTSFARTTPASAEEYPPSKRSRTRKSSITSSASPEAYREETPAPGTNMSAAEDKRRRNTAASARFRLKKKEREAALEGKAKELETRVNELERECEGLRRENGWLKGLVVGVTGAAQGPIVPQSITPPPNGATLTTGSKRARDEVDRA
ncbi:hypothetical protein BDQ12DRAFT_717450 [Crucibulum laeve]|uniref:BZIP domain-containing protein n=1 Tax=Crucibulum laeve TaxID=68775 RepID=A0A5C3MK68_9AGAR|nr:hypothetical protein BDQ12DRAFT_717450 [Crucibulum laeve]